MAEKCILCGCVNSEFLFSVKEFRLFYCKKCQLAWTSPGPPEGELQKANRTLYSSADYKQMYFSQKEGLSQRFTSRLREIEKYKKPGKLLDIGCGFGLFLNIAKQRGWEGVGIEICPELAEFARREYNLTILDKSFEEANFPNNSFDVVTLWDVLEHMRHPIESLVRVHHVLKNDGLLAIQCPNIDSFLARLGGPKWGWLTPPDHLYHFTPKSLEETIKRAGFKLASLATWEPLEAFMEGVITYGLPQTSFPILRNIERLSKLFLLAGGKLVSSLFESWQQTKWQKSQGALIIAYATPNK